MQPVERNPRFKNPLVSSASRYLQQHAHNPVFWYPWGEEALNRAKSENKPILLSVGYSTCYWCHVMEREVFENLSIASLMNRCFINIKVDREEHPAIDEIYMVARQVMTREGGWPNNVFLTPDLRPFYAGGTYGPDESYGKPSFPNLLEWLNHAWTTQEQTVRATADQITDAMKPYLTFTRPENPAPADIRQTAGKLCEMFRNYHDGRAGGFFQSPKFPHECYLQFLISYYECTGDAPIFDMVAFTLGKMASGGIYDQVAGGFHRYAVDKEWYIPHFEKMLYNQAMLARVYTDAARLSGHMYFADIAKSILDFTAGPLRDGNGGFYAAIDAETDGIEGQYYAWTAEELTQLLSPEEAVFLQQYYALADIPAFPGHKHAKGQVLIARKPLALAAAEHNMPYVQLAAMSGQIMNKLLEARNQRPSPTFDDKIITAWNGLMIDAYAHAGRIFSDDQYIEYAQKAADYILEHAIDNDGNLQRMVAGGRAQGAATLEDYAYMIKGLLSLHRARPDTALLASITGLMARTEEWFADSAGGYFNVQADERLILRIKTGDDSTLPGPNAVMLQNHLELYEITKEQAHLDQARRMAAYFIDGNDRILVEMAGMIQGALMLDALVNGKKPAAAQKFGGSYTVQTPPAPDGIAEVSARLLPEEPKAGADFHVVITIDLKEGWHIQPVEVQQPFLIPTQVDVQGEGIEKIGLTAPPPLQKEQPDGSVLPVYEGRVELAVRMHWFRKQKSRPPLKVLVRFQPCHGTTCHAVKDYSITL